MTDPREIDPDGPTDRSATPRRGALVWLLVLLLAAETALLAVASAYLLIELLTVLATVWLGAIVVGTLRGKAWIRGAAIVWQVLQVAVGVGSLQGATANASVGVWLIVPAVLVVVLLLVPSVVAATSQRDDSPPAVF